MPYINLDLDYENHPRTMRLVGLLGRGAEMLPIRLWLYCGKYLSDSGEFTGFSAQEIESIARWWGKSGEMIAALEKCVDEKGVPFIIKTDNGWKIPNWLDINGHLQVFKERAKIASKKRWDKYRMENASSIASSNPVSNAQAMLKQCSIPNHTILKKKEIIKEKEVKDLNSTFSEFWINYPRKIAKQTAFSSWFKLRPDKELFEKIMIGLKKQCKSVQWTNENGKFIPHPSTWINGRRWEDEIYSSNEQKSHFERDRERREAQAAMIRIWRNSGLSPCHGKRIVEEEGKRWCDECLRRLDEHGNEIKESEIEPSEINIGSDSKNKIPVLFLKEIPK